MEDDGGFTFITANNPAGFKKKKIMTTVRKKAMGSYLQNEKERKPRQSREPSTGSRSSIGSTEQEAVEAIIANEEALKIFRGESRRAGRRTSSPTKSPASSGNDRHSVSIPSPENQLVRMPQPVDMAILEQAPMVRPPRTDVKLVYDATAPRPFQSVGKSVDPFKTMHQANHPSISVEYLKFHCSRAFGTRAMGQHWIPTLVKSPHAFLSTLCIASAHHDAVSDMQFESLHTTALRQEVIHLISQNLVNPSSRIDDYNIIAVTQLIASEMIAGGEATLDYHEAGVAKMVTQRGGLNQLGVKGRLASTLSWVSLESAVLRETKPRSMYADFCTSAQTKNYPPTATIPESPLFCPRSDLNTVKRSSRSSSSPRTLDLLKDIRMMMEFFLHETKHSRQNSQSLKNLYKKITTEYPSAADMQKTTVLTVSDWTYEAVRIAAVIQATAMVRRIPLSEALKVSAHTNAPTSLYSSSNASKSSDSLVSPTAIRHDSPLTSFSTSPSYVTSADSNFSSYFPPQSKSTSKFSISSSTTDFSSFFPAPAAPAPTGPSALLANLKTALDNSDLSDVWNDMAGVLFWISLVVGAASRKSDKVLKKWFSALAIRCSIVLCFEHPEAIHSTLLRMTEFVEAAGYGTNDEVVRRTSSTSKRRESSIAAGKRRRV
ncbi:hypothetical protein BDV96DRAFT_485209 [Lophiotrema nucula]|uniref:Fungal-specific transcription factor domain-containing protein n=1 Tax=Lophiotrema nucula TaxID=690887 RepID=A0A6A5ZM18_9PLEO|nr:hypothetical protein BDV96DRAFT_485209 [Lophiotrema nucula]